MKALVIAAVVSVACLASTAEANPPAPPGDVLLSWTVIPGTFAAGVWTLPDGTTVVTASVVDQVTGDPVTVGELVWETCSGTGRDLAAHHSFADCLQHGSVRWKGAVIIDPANPVPISPCLCAGDQQGFRLVFKGRKTGYSSEVGDPFDLLAVSNCPARTDCP